MSQRGPVNTRTLLVSMPFQSAESPSLALGLLSAIGRRRGFAVDTAHFTLDLSAAIGVEVYEALCGSCGHEVGNWLFALAAFADEAPDQADRFPYDRPDVMDDLRDAGIDEAALVMLRRNVVPAYLAGLEQAVDWANYGVVGFTSTFEQHVASLAMARRLKTRFPHLVILFGGANCAGEMGRELARSCAWIDYVVDGEGDEVFPAILQALASGSDPMQLDGVLSRQAQTATAAHVSGGLDQAPTPEFGEFYQRAEQLGLADPSRRHLLRLPFEASRGCWWGQKHHCTFCGLNGQFMSFRQKTPARVLDELAELSRRYGVFRFNAVDNIMPHDFLRSFLPALAAEERGYNIFFEIKSNLSRQDVKLLREAGVRHIQPGIESLSSAILRTMRKGVSAIQNVNLLRWARYYGVSAAWNVLHGFPDERAEDYSEQASLMEVLFHLEPPQRASRVELQRFSPFHFDRGRFPVRSIAPGSELMFVYPEAFDLGKLAFYFDHEFETQLDDAEFDLTRSVIDQWRAAWAEPAAPSLTYRWSPGLLHLEDARKPDAPLLYAFEGPVADIYRAIAERPTSAAMISPQTSDGASAAEVTEVLDLFVSKGLAMRDQGQYLALALPDNDR
jgi:ribosomal peptide maturation radical SAM protein 1